jgi:hypothetical protein
MSKLPVHIRSTGPGTTYKSLRASRRSEKTLLQDSVRAVSNERREASIELLIS